MNVRHVRPADCAAPRRPCSSANARPRSSSARGRGRVEVEALAAEFDVTTQTIRRDLNELRQRGLLARHHGGAGPATRW